MRLLAVSSLAFIVTVTELPATQTALSALDHGKDQGGVTVLAKTVRPSALTPGLEPANLLLSGSALEGTQSALLTPKADGTGSFELPINGIIDSEASAPKAAAAPRAERRVFSPETICDSLVSAATEHKLPVVFFTRLIWQESRLNPNSVSHAGAQGVAQFMPASAADRGLADPFDPVQALPASARFLRDLRREFGNWGLAAAAYNAGPGRVRNWLSRRARLPRETRDYVMKITGHSPESWVGAEPRKAVLTTPERIPCRNIPEEVASADITAVPMPPQRPSADSFEDTAPEPRVPARLMVASAGDEMVAMPRAAKMSLVAEGARFEERAKAEARPSGRVWTRRFVAAKRENHRASAASLRTVRAKAQARFAAAASRVAAPRIQAVAGSPKRMRMAIAIRGRN